MLIGSLAGVAFPDAANGWAVGAGASGSPGGGLIVHTTDGGSTWSQQVAPDNANLLQGVAFVDGSRGWAVGSNTSNGGLVLATIDGGSSWKAETPPAGVGPLSAVTFTSSTTGWAVGGSSIIATTNGGVTWTSQTVPSGVIALAGVSFASPTAGWAVGAQSFAGGAILATTNGGATWTTLSIPSGTYSLYGITSTSPTTAWAVGNGPQGVILATTDGGTTWTQQTTPTSSSMLSGVAFSGSAGWAVGGDSNGARIILRTTNGGSTWAQQAPPPAAHSVLTAVAATSPNSAIAVGGGECGSPSVLTTADGGTTWTSQISQRVAVHILKAVAFGTAAKGWAVGDDTCSNGVVLATGDGGATWQRQPLPTTVDDLSGVTFSNATTGWAVGNQNHRSPTHVGTTIVATTDGGLTWSEQAHPYLLFLDGIASFGVSLAWATGSDGSSGIIVATTDGGATWNKQTLPAGVGTLYGIRFVNATTGWAVGTKAGSNAGVILATTNGGTTWVSQNPPAATGPLYALSFLSATTGWVVGATTSYQAEILATADGGSTWAAQTPPGAQSQVQGVSFASPAVGWTVGTGISATTDGGRTWLRQAGFPTTYLNGVASSGLNTAWAVGWSSCQPVRLFGGTIVATTDGGANWSTQFDDCPSTAPVVSQLSPSVGPAAGGTVVTVTGTGFTGATAVKFGAAAATAFTVNSDTQIHATSPAGSGTVDVKVTTPGGTSAPVSGDQFTYSTQALPPTVTGVTPNVSPTAGGTTVTITGTNLGGAAVHFGTLTASVTANTDTQITVTSPATTTPGTVDVRVTTAGGTSAVTPADQFNYGDTVTTSNPGQFQLVGNDGSTWKDMDPNGGLSLTISPPTNSMAILTGNADLWTSKAGVNQDIGIYVAESDVATYPGHIVAWKESGGYAGTYSPNAAAVQTVFPMAAGTTYHLKLQWKTNQQTSGTIVVGAGPWPATNPSYSPTTLTARLATADTVSSGVSTKQYVKAGSDGATWVDIDSTSGTPLTTEIMPAIDSLAVLSGNVDLWTAKAGVNQDVGIYVTESDTTTFPGHIVAWKESGGYAGTYSPNAAFVQTVFPMRAGITYHLKLQWKTNKVTDGTIVVGAGPWPANLPTYSPTRLTVQLMPASALSAKVSNRQYTLANSDGANWSDIDTTSSTPLSLTLNPTANCTAIISGNADLWTTKGGYNQDIGIFVFPSNATGNIVAWKESGGYAGTYSPNAAFVQAMVSLQANTPYTIKLQWKTNKASNGAVIVVGAGPWPANVPTYSPTTLTAQLFGCG